MASDVHGADVDLLLGHRLRRWPNVKSTLDKLPLFVGQYINQI